MALRSALEAIGAQLLRNVFEVQHHAQVEAVDHRFEAHEIAAEATEALRLSAEIAGQAGLEWLQRRVEEPACRRPVAA